MENDKIREISKMEEIREINKMVKQAR